MVRRMSKTRPLRAKLPTLAALAGLGAVLSAGLLVGAGCGPAPEERLEPVFPDDAETAWTEIRDCRHSHEHDLRFIRVFASPDAEAPYLALSPDEPYPVGALLLKLEYDDAQCTDLLGYTALEKLSPGAAPSAGDWMWQRVGPDREVLEQGAMPRCINCHSVHCGPPHGYDLTCAEEI